MLMQDRLPLSDHLLFVSGRTSFEIVQKAFIGRHPAGRRRLGAVEPGDRARAGLRRDARRLPAGRELQHLRSPRTDRRTKKKKKVLFVYSNRVFVKSAVQPWDSLPLYQEIVRKLGFLSRNSEPYWLIENGLTTPGWNVEGGGFLFFTLRNISPFVSSALASSRPLICAFCRVRRHRRGVQGVLGRASSAGRGETRPGRRPKRRQLRRSLEAAESRTSLCLDCTAKGVVKASYQAHGKEFFYAVNVPESYDPARRYQVRFQLHGGVSRESNKPARRREHRRARRRRTDLHPPDELGRRAVVERRRSSRTSTRFSTRSSGPTTSTRIASSSAACRTAARARTTSR